jgi:ribosomal protein S18 acetylase RimI-like enzyme
MSNISQKNQYEIREMTPEDFSAVRALWTRTGIGLTASDEPEELSRMIRHNPGLCIVAMEKKTKTIISAVMGGFDGRRGWVHHLAVDPNFQRQKIGTEMVKELVERFRMRNVVKIKLEVTKNNISVVEFYKKLNWELRNDIVTMTLALKK